MVYYLVTKTDIENAKKTATETGKKFYACLIDMCPRVAGKYKADLVKQGAIMAGQIGVKECWIFNITTGQDKIFKRDESGRLVKKIVVYYTLNQSWFILNDGTGWFFKMTDKCIAKHPIEGVA